MLLDVISLKLKTLKLLSPFVILWVCERSWSYTRWKKQPNEFVDDGFAVLPPVMPLSENEITGHLSNCLFITTIRRQAELYFFTLFFKFVLLDFLFSKLFYNYLLNKFDFHPSNIFPVPNIDKITSHQSIASLTRRKFLWSN